MRKSSTWRMCWTLTSTTCQGDKRAPECSALHPRVHTMCIFRRMQKAAERLGYDQWRWDEDQPARTEDQSWVCHARMCFDCW